jgi:hypothetical protein
LPCGRLDLLRVPGWLLLSKRLGNLLWLSFRDLLHWMCVSAAGCVDGGGYALMLLLIRVLTRVLIRVAWCWRFLRVPCAAQAPLLFCHGP